MTTTASELADELEAAALEMETGEDTKPSFIATLRKSATALRRMEKLERVAAAARKLVFTTDLHASLQEPQ